MVLLHIPTVLRNYQSVLANPLDGLDHVGLETEVERGKSQFFEVVVEMGATLNGNFYGLVGILVVVAVLCIDLFEVLVVEELVQNHPRQPCLVRVVVLHEDF